MGSLVPEGPCDAHNIMQDRPRDAQNNAKCISLDNEKVKVQLWKCGAWWRVEKVTEKLKEK